MAASLGSFLARRLAPFFSSSSGFVGSICHRNAQVLPALLTPINKNGASVEVSNRSVMMWTDWRMIKNIKRRKGAVQYAPEVLRMTCLRKNKILPRELREIADADNLAIPRISYKSHCTNRCVITSRGKYVFQRWRLSRIMFRHQVDYNFMSGIQRAMW